MFFIHFYSSPLCPSFRAPCDCPISPFMSGIERAVMLTGIGLVPFYLYDDMLNYRSDFQHTAENYPQFGITTLDIWIFGDNTMCCVQLIFSGLPPTLSDDVAI